MAVGWTEKGLCWNSKEAGVSNVDCARLRLTRRTSLTGDLELIDWRRQVAALYADVRAEADPARGHAVWRAGRDRLFRAHPQSPLTVGDPLRETGLPYWPYDPALRFELELRPAFGAGRRLAVHGGEEDSTRMVLIGCVQLPPPFDAAVDVWWLDQYAGGIFLPLRDGTAGRESYGGGRYALDTSKGADLGGNFEHLIVDLNFLYHPSCRYDSRWLCPLAPPGNTIITPVTAGERLRSGGL
jgi:uncharacterized protein (DUF1684 family)